MAKGFSFREVNGSEFVEVVNYVEGSLIQGAIDKGAGHLSNNYSSL